MYWPHLEAGAAAVRTPSLGGGGGGAVGQKVSQQAELEQCVWLPTPPGPRDGAEITLIRFV